ncbi:MAG: hypothetical protein K2I46_06225, partial [Clostridia bacterium]|nr:hypothetical protein [Clostridia bacterium]
TEIGKIDCYINFAVRAGKVVWGVDNLERGRRVPYLILIDGSLGANSSKQLSLYCQKKQAKSLTLPTDYLNNLLKRSNIKVLSILDESLANAILKYCED